MVNKHENDKRISLENKPFCAGQWVRGWVCEYAIIWFVPFFVLFFGRQLFQGLILSFEIPRSSFRDTFKNEYFIDKG